MAFPGFLVAFGFELDFGMEDELELEVEVGFLASFFSSWTLMLLFPPRRGALSFQRAHRTMTGIKIVKKTVIPITIPNFAVPDKPCGSGSGPGRVVWQEVSGKLTEHGAVVVCIEHVL